MSTLKSAKMSNLRDKLRELEDRESEEEVKEEIAKVGKSKSLKVNKKE